MEVAAKLKGARMSAQKARLVADQIRGKSVESALEILQFSGRKGADIIKKVLESAIANAASRLLPCTSIQLLLRTSDRLLFPLRHRPLWLLPTSELPVLLHHCSGIPSLVNRWV